MENFGHIAHSFGSTFIDTWGAGPYTLRVGKRRYYFTDSDMFGPLLESKAGRVLDVQPISEEHPFWAAYHMWRRGGRSGKKTGRWIVCRWRPQGMEYIGRIKKAFRTLSQTRNTINLGIFALPP